MSHAIADRELMTALGTAAGKNSASILGGHTGAKPMLVHSFTVSRLVSSFHDLKSIFLDEGINLVFIPLKFQGLDWLWSIIFWKLCQQYIYP